MSQLHQASALVSSQNGGLSYGMGWFIGATGGVSTSAHDGYTANFHAEMVIVPSPGWGLVLLVNAYGLIALATALDQMTQGVTSLLMGQQPPLKGSVSRCSTAALTWPSCCSQHCSCGCC
jgi:hypothetical protein